MVRSADENVGGSVVVIFWVSEVIGKPYYVSSADENVDASVVDVLLFFVIENYYSVVDIFWVSEVVGKPYYVRSADENVGGSVGFDFLFLFEGFDKFLVVSYGGGEARS